MREWMRMGVVDGGFEMGVEGRWILEMVSGDGCMHDHV